MKCAMCGCEFSCEQAATACAGCPLARGCKLIRCPKCGYETVAGSRLGGLIRKLRGGGAPPAEVAPADADHCPRRPGS